ncbi:MAG TPA: hypothetical protein VF154_18385, partial [Terriglobales bacterium]
MKVSITVVATKTLAAGRRMLVLLDIAFGIYFNGRNTQISFYLRTNAQDNTSGGGLSASSGDKARH